MQTLTPHLDEMLIETVQLLGSSELETALERPTFGYVRLTPDNNIELLAGFDVHTNRIC